METDGGSSCVASHVVKQMLTKLYQKLLERKLSWRIEVKIED